MNLNNITALIKSLFTSLLTTLLLILLASFITFKFDPGNSFVKVAIVVINIVSCMLSGVVCSRLVNSRKIIWSSIAGITYFAILLVTSLIINNGSIVNPAALLSSFILSFISACVGSFLAV